MKTTMMTCTVHSSELFRDGRSCWSAEYHCLRAKHREAWGKLVKESRERLLSLVRSVPLDVQLLRRLSGRKSDLSVTALGHDALAVYVATTCTPEAIRQRRRELARQARQQLLQLRLAEGDLQNILGEQDGR